MPTIKVQRNDACIPPHRPTQLRSRAGPASTISRGLWSGATFRGTQVPRTDHEHQRAFDRKNTVDLHHLALNVEGEDGLATAFARSLQAPGVTIEFGPELLGKGPSRHMMCRIPGGVRLELIAPAQKT